MKNQVLIINSDIKESKEISLTPIQYRLLCSLANHMGEVLTKEQMYATGWDEDFEVNIDEAVKYQIKELRRKLARQAQVTSSKQFGALATSSH